MKKILFIIISFFVVGRFVEAETFFEGKFINGEYVNKEINGINYYMTMQYIKDSKGNIVYCIEPFVDFSEGKSYVSYIGDLKSYKNLSKEQKRKIELITYYGYGYNNRKDDKWYVITQYLVWKTVDNNADIYFTKTLNGKRIDKYKNEIKQLLNDVDGHDITPFFVKKYTVNYGKDLIISEVGNNYEVIESDFEYKLDGDLKILKVLNNGTIKLKKKSNIYNDKIAIFDSSNSQDLIRPGNIENNILLIDLKVTSGDITLDIKDDDSVYTIESDFTNTCYEIDNGSEVIEKICTGDEPVIYRTLKLPYGSYTIKQVSVGVGYKDDIKTYKVEISDKDEHPVLVLYNYLLKNKIEIIKRYCKNNICNFEFDALFKVYDKYNNLVDEIVTDDNGYTSITLGYGSYNVEQVRGLQNYSLEKSFMDKIVDEVTVYRHELYNYFIGKEPVIIEKEDPVPEKIDEYLENPESNEDIYEVVEDIPSPPNTRVDKKGFFWNLKSFFRRIFEVIFDNSYII